MKSADIIGKPVVGQHGRTIGDVADVDLDVGTWRILGFDVKLRRDVVEELGRHRPWLGTVTVRIDADLVSGIGDQVVLRVAIEQLASRLGEPAPEQPQPGA